jgi:hypothetical protein
MKYKCIFIYFRIVAYLLDARKAEPQKHANNGTTGLCNPLLGNGSVSTHPLRRNYVTLQQHLAIMWLVFCVVCGTRVSLQSRRVFSRVQRFQGD